MTATPATPAANPQALLLASAIHYAVRNINPAALPAAILHDTQANQFRVEPLAACIAAKSSRPQQIRILARLQLSDLHQLRPICKTSANPRFIPALFEHAAQLIHETPESAPHLHELVNLTIATKTGRNWKSAKRRMMTQEEAERANRRVCSTQLWVRIADNTPPNCQSLFRFLIQPSSAEPASRPAAPSASVLSIETERTNLTSSYQYSIGRSPNSKYSRSTSNSQPGTSPIARQ
jgi:hypothetical protein